MMLFDCAVYQTFRSFLTTVPGFYSSPSAVPSKAASISASSAEVTPISCAVEVSGQDPPLAVNLHVVRRRWHDKKDMGSLSRRFKYWSAALGMVLLVFGLFWLGAYILQSS